MEMGISNCNARFGSVDSHLSPKSCWGFYPNTGIHNKVTKLANASTVILHFTFNVDQE